MAAGGPEARAVGGAATAAAARNIALAGSLAEVVRSLRGGLPRLPPPAPAALECEAAAPTLLAPIAAPRSADASPCWDAVCSSA